MLSKEIFSIGIFNSGAGGYRSWSVSLFAYNSLSESVLRLL